jgi:hypothetical protein
LPLAKVAPVFALGFVEGAVMDYLALGIPLHMVANRVRDGRDA